MNSRTWQIDNSECPSCVSSDILHVTTLYVWQYSCTTNSTIKTIKVHNMLRRTRNYKVVNTHLYTTNTASENMLLYVWCGFDCASLLICGNKMPTRCDRWFLLQILLLAQHVSGTTAPIIRSSRLLYKWLLPVVFGALVFELSVWCGHTTLSSTPYRQLENQSTKYHRQQPPV